jgi:hypothetical protein
LLLAHRPWQQNNQFSVRVWQQHFSAKAFAFRLLLQRRESAPLIERIASGYPLGSAPVESLAAPRRLEFALP